PPPSPRVWLDAAAERTADRLIGPSRPVLALAPAAAAPFKEWAPDRFAALADRLTGTGGVLEGACVVLFGGPGDGATARAVKDAATADVLDLTGRLDLLEAAACLARARLFVGNDSGLMHMAAAVGAPTLGLFGPTDERVYGPWGPRARAIRAGDAADEAERGRLRHSETSLMGRLDVDQAAEAAEALLAETG
ncbi:MAG: glycosyltransferase family 9 protein, partial [Oceanicaulis sp.]